MKELLIVFDENTKRFYLFFLATCVLGANYEQRSWGEGSAGSFKGRHSDG